MTRRLHGREAFEALLRAGVGYIRGSLTMYDAWRHGYPPDMTFRPREMAEPVTDEEIATAAEQLIQALAPIAVGATVARSYVESNAEVEVRRLTEAIEIATDSHRAAFSKPSGPFWNAKFLTAVRDGAAITDARNVADEAWARAGQVIDGLGGEVIPPPMNLAALQTALQTVGAAMIELRTGPPPAMLGDVDTGEMLASGVFGGGDQAELGVVRTGTVGHFRVYDTNRTCHMQGTAEDLHLDNPNIQITQDVAVRLSFGHA